MKDLILIYNAFFDLIIRLLPQIKKREGVAFLVHPRDVKDVIEKYPFFKYFSKNTINWVLKHFWPITISQIEGITDKNNKPINGWVISCPLLAEYMLKNRKDAKKFIIKTAKLAEKKGAKMIGLGALTTSLTQGGLDIQDHTNCRIITGKLFTAKIVTDTTVNILKKLELNKEEITVSILGAAGSIGSASAQILAKKGFNKINLIDLSHKSEEINEIKKFMQKLNPKISITVSNKVKSVKDSDIIIAATNKPDALIKSKHLKQGAVIVDDAQPSDVDEEIIKNRKDVIVLEGGVINFPKINPNFKFGLKNKGDVFSCLAELIIMAYTKDKLSYNIGKIISVDFNILEKMENVSKEIGIKTADFQNSEKVYSEEEIDFVKKIIKKNNLNK